MADEAAKPQVQEPAPAASSSGGKPTIAVKVYAPFKIYFEGNAYSLSGINDVGPFDILPKHHNFLCMLAPSELRIVGVEGEKVVKISRALMHVKADRVVVFMDV